MVQRALPLQQRSHYPAREHRSPDERPFPNNPLPEGSNNGGSIHPRTLTIEESLRECARLTSLDKFALIILQDNGEERTYTSQSLKLHQSQIFSESFRAQFRAAAGGSFSSPGYEDSLFSDFNVDHEQRYRKQSSSCDSLSGTFRRQRQLKETSDYSEDDDSPTVKRRRNRPHHRGSFFADQMEDGDSPEPLAIRQNQPLVIGQSAAVGKFYSRRFRDMQQSACKVMGKVFVKFVEPKKQTHHPYTHGDEKAPEWWPLTIGNNKVRHKEPDHLLKGVHILRLVVQPNHLQHHSIQKLNLDVKQLEEVTMEAMARWFEDKDNPANAEKKPFLREIFRVAKYEQRCLHGEIGTFYSVSLRANHSPYTDGASRVFVLSSKRGDFDSDDESEDGTKEEGGDDSDTASLSTMASTAGTPLLTEMIPQQQSGIQPQSPTHTQQAQQIQPRPDENTMFLGMRQQLPYRYHPQSMEEHTGSFADNSVYAPNIAFSPQPSTIVHDQTRRSFASPSYNPPPQNLYGWQSMVSSGVANSSYYTTSPEATVSTAYQLPPPLIAQQNLLPPPVSPHAYDSLPSRMCDSGTALGSQFRTGSLSHPHHVPLQHGGFQQYIQDNDGYSPELRHSPDHPHTQ
ncbi:hypothetical protein B7494_g8635 [Chlorociboria aeruginascens]|nr:hypothetical protein B7494_g8635 [Chlorociboria aeruginascens]